MSNSASAIAEITPYDGVLDARLKTELTTLEKLNPCRQRYYVSPMAFFVQYHQTVDLFNFIPWLSLRVPVKIIGKPYSVSQKGYMGDNQAVTALVKTTQGLNLVLNGEPGLDLPFVYTLSSHVFHSRFATFDHYLEALRSHYRYRVKKALVKAAMLEVVPLAPADFSSAHYALYLEVYKNSKDKLECLSLTFFKEFPSEMFAFKVRESGECIGFIQLVQEGKQLTFLFGGFMQAHNRQYDLYMNLLLEIIRIGIERRVDVIEFGQTAEETKLKLGCMAVKKYLYVHHSNKVLNYGIARILPLLSYKPHVTSYSVFKEPL